MFIFYYLLNLSKISELYHQNILSFFFPSRAMPGTSPGVFCAELAKTMFLIMVSKHDTLEAVVDKNIYQILT